jgi:tRNA pseudouridine38-40 synthase
MTNKRKLKRYKGLVSYDGGAYSGFQIQPDTPTIQEELQKVLTQMHKREVTIIGSGRTDAGVHAREQVIHFDSELTLRSDQWVKALNSKLNADIRVQRIAQFNSEFHARYDAERKQYRYFLYRSQVENPFKRRYAVHVAQDVNLERMREASKFLIGTYDFTAFSSTNTGIKDKIRTIYRLDVLEDGEHLIIICEGNGFLYNMVRIIVGSLVEVGQGRRTVEELRRALDEKDRTLTGKTYPSHGLFLWSVHYPKKVEEIERSLKYDD